MSSQALSRDSHPRTAVRRDFIGTFGDPSVLVNCAGNYDYLSSAYYLSQDYEDEQPIRPTCPEMLDAYVPPLFLEKAKAAGLPVPEWYLSNGYFEPPVIADPINPFTLRGKIVWKEGRAKSIARSLTRNFTYAICCQELPPGSKVRCFRDILGWTATLAYRDLASSVWRVFNIPLAKVRVIHPPDRSPLLSDISPLPYDTLSPREIARIEEQVSWLK